MRRVVPIAVPGTFAVGLYVVTGNGRPATGAHTCLAIRVVDAVKQAGFWAVSLHASKFRNSNSRYVDFKDAFARHWRIRISDHLRPPRSSIPHFDLISVDGLAGLDDTQEFLRLVAAGNTPWFDSIATADIVSAPERKRINRCR